MIPECDTDDEIEKVLNKQKKRKLEDSPSPERDAASLRGGDVSRNSDVEFVKDERVQGNVTIEDTDPEDTDEETHQDTKIKVRSSIQLDGETVINVTY